MTDNPTIDGTTQSTSASGETYTIKVPDVGEGVAEVEIVNWLVRVGDTIARLQTVAEVMTDKATVEVPSPIDGVVVDLGGAVGDVLLVGSPLMHLATGDSPVIERSADGPATEESADEPIEISAEVTSALESMAADEAPPAALQSSTPPSGVELRPHPTGAPVVEANGVAADRFVVPRRSHPITAETGPRVMATPAVRRRARDLGLDLRKLAAEGFATGPAGRVSHEDLDHYLAGDRSMPDRRSGDGGGGRPAPRTGSTQQPVVGLRRRIAQQMVNSASTIPHITYVEEVDVTALEDLRADLNKRAADRPGQPRLTILPFLVRALVNAIDDYPHLNAHLNDGESTADAAGPAAITTYDGVHVGIATQTDNGLIVPVLRHAEAHTIWSTATSIAALSEATRNGTAAAEQLSGSTITITSLGALGGIVTTPIINKPEVAIVGVNKIVTRPVWIDGEFVPRKIMNLSSSFDHRVIDGWDAANFVQAIRVQLEQPALLFIDEFVPDVDA